MLLVIPAMSYVAIRNHRENVRADQPDLGMLKCYSKNLRNRAIVNDQEALNELKVIAENKRQEFAIFRFKLGKYYLDRNEENNAIYLFIKCLEGDGEAFVNKALKKLETLIESAEALFRLGIYYRDLDINKSNDKFYLAAKKKHEHALNYLIKNFEKDPNTTLKVIENLSVENPDAQSWIGNKSFSEGDFVNAYRFFFKAASNDAEANQKITNLINSGHIEDDKQTDAVEYFLNALHAVDFDSLESHFAYQNLVEMQNRNNSRAIEAIRKLKYDFFLNEINKNQLLLDIPDNEEIVIAFGDSGAGKSTLLNYLAGPEIIGLKTWQRKILLSNPNDSNALRIGTGSSSKTRRPHPIKINNSWFVDMPGLRDTEGSFRNLLTACFLKKILERPGGVKLLLVFNETDVINGRGASLKRTLKNLTEMFGNDHQYLLDHSSLLVITRSRGKDVEDEKNWILSELDEVDQQLLNRWIDYDKFCHMPEPSGNEINYDARDKILSAVQSLKSSEVKNLKLDVIYPNYTKNDLKDIFESQWNETLKNQEFQQMIFAMQEPNEQKIWEHFDKFCQTNAVRTMCYIGNDIFHQSLSRFREQNIYKIKEAIKDYQESLILSESNPKFENPEVMSIFIRKSKVGNTVAQIKLGQHYIENDELKRDEGEKLLLEAINTGGNAEAAFLLATYYGYGDYLEKDIENSLKYYKLAVDGQHAAAQNDLGVCYLEGRIGLDKNITEAVRLFKLAAEQGNRCGQRNLGVCFENGWGVTQSDQEAVKYYLLAAGIKAIDDNTIQWVEKGDVEGDSDAKYILSNHFKNGTCGLLRSNSIFDLLFRSALDCGCADAIYDIAMTLNNKMEKLSKLREAAKKGSQKAQKEICKMYIINHVGFSHNDTKWFKILADGGDAQAQYELGDLYECGKGGYSGEEEAFEYYQKAAAQNHSEATYKIGYFYKHGMGSVRKNAAKAIENYRRAKSFGSVEASKKLEVNREKIKKWAKYLERRKDSRNTYAFMRLKMAAEENENKYAQYELSICYKYGYGIGQNREHALILLKKAKEQGHNQATRDLERLNEPLPKRQRVEQNNEDESEDTESMMLGERKLMKINEGISYGANDR